MIGPKQRHSVLPSECKLNFLDPAAWSALLDVHIRPLTPFTHLKRRRTFPTQRRATEHYRDVFLSSPCAPLVHPRLVHSRMTAAATNANSAGVSCYLFMFPSAEIQFIILRYTISPAGTYTYIHDLSNVNGATWFLLSH